MKMYSVSAIWHKFRAKKQSIQTVIILAESKEKAIEIFKEKVSYPENAIIRALEHEDGIYTLRQVNF